MKAEQHGWKRLGLALAGMALIASCGCSSTHYAQSTGAPLTDEAISTRVRHRLAVDPTYGYPNVEVFTANGVTELRGYACSWEAVDHAANVAMFTKGVQLVQNNIVQQY